MNMRQQTAQIIRDELASSDSVLIPEQLLVSFLGEPGVKLDEVVAKLADENGWTARRTEDHHWHFTR
jgi:hypothetical protein